MDLKIDFDLQPNEADPMRSWTYMDKDGARQLTNGTSILQNQTILEIFIKK